MKSHLFRFALAGLVVTMLFLGRTALEFESAPGRLMFKWMTIANWVVVTLAGGTVFAIAISEETEQQTLGLLRMANVSPLSLLIGKWLPRMLMAIVLLSIQFPFTWLTVTLGGVSWHQIWAGYLMLLAHLILVGNVGLLASVMSPNSSRACGMAFVLMLTARLLPYVIWGVVQYSGMKGWVPMAWAMQLMDQVVSPINQCSASGRLFGEILMTSFRGNAWNSQVASNFALGAGLFVVSWGLFDRATMRHMSGATPKPNLLVRLFSRQKRASSRTWNWSLGWKDFHQVGGGIRLILLKFVSYAIFFGGVYYANIQLVGATTGEALETSCGVVAWVTFFFLLPLELSCLAAKLFRPELNNQTWSTLLTLPKSLPEIAYAKLGGALLGVIPTFICLQMTSAPFWSEIAHDLFQHEEIMFLIVYLFAAFFCGLHLVTYFSISIDWAVWPVAVILGMVVTFLSNFVAWIVFILISLFVYSGDGDHFLYAWLVLLTTVQTVLAIVLHLAIGQSLTQKGAMS